MSVGTRTESLLKITSPARGLDIEASHEALVQACVDTGDDAGRAELVSDSPNHLWLLPAERTLAMVHPDPDEAWAVVRSARFLRQQGVAVTTPWYSDVRPSTGGLVVTFWPAPGKRRADPAWSAWATALTHRIDPAAAPWLRPHDPFAGMGADLDNAPLKASDRYFLRERVAGLREEWEYLDWPTSDVVVLGGRGMVPVHDDGVRVGLLLRRPLTRGHREWDLVAARWRSELLIGPSENQSAYTRTYQDYERPDQAQGRFFIGIWSGYRVVRDVVVLTAVMDTVRRAHLDDGIRAQAAHRIACLRGTCPAPWNWGPR
ncbi:hypothetical protein [Streptomyces sp. CBMA156]|uniref:hypothetical protein n=1 Tax=Streptomyces sp. CBMA156 TaxID=1930280 RepID=UPI001661F3F2|nr:hypothetical protein [Streptomyces sp. CBMA156]MBD0670073.1 hypothetical protein [Streptomyces sp. CBMA156]